jgi:hypothetical protein
MFRQLEERLSTPGPTESRQSLGSLLADGFEELGSSGRVFDAKAVLDGLTQGGRPRVTLEGFTAVRLAEEVVLVRYVSRHGAGAKPPARRSSLWICRAGAWQLRFHQGTPLPAGG